jgi:hypothetical protein
MSVTFGQVTIVLDADRKVSLIRRMNRLATLMSLLATAADRATTPEYDTLCDLRFSAVEREWLAGYHEVYG